MRKILAVVKDAGRGSFFLEHLNQHGYEVQWIDQVSKAISILKNQSFDLVLATFSSYGIPATKLIRSDAEGLVSPVILMGEDNPDIRQAVYAIKEGAADYLVPPVQPEELLHSIATVLEKKLPTPINAAFVSALDPTFKKVEQQIELVAPTNYSVLIYGESGTGKEMVARKIHSLSARKNNPFIAIDCGAMNEELAASELFGHEKGSFTGAYAQKIGCFEQASTGTIFLDEVANLPYSIQVSLLRVVQERLIKRVGSSIDIPVDVRIVMASNENLLNKARKGRFREDLFYRLNEFEIEIPPLRERKEDILVLTNYFIKEANLLLNKSIDGCSTEVVELLCNYSWPGNIRELKNVVHRAALLAVSTITPDCLPEVFHTPKRPMAEPEPLVASRPEGLNVSLRNAILHHEYALIERTLKQHNNNKSKVAKVLNIDRKTLYNKIALFKSLSKES